MKRGRDAQLRPETQPEKVSQRGRGKPADGNGRAEKVRLGSFQF